MNFLNIALLGGAVACSIPIVIHLLNRSRQKTLDWGAMQFLESALESNSRSFHWEALLLLLIRTLIPVVLAVALARPVLTSFQVAGSGQSKAIAFVVDNSLSMSRRTGDESSFAFAKKTIQELAGQFSSAEKSLRVTAPDGSMVIAGLSFQSDAIEQSIQELTIAGAGDSALFALENAIRETQSANAPSKHVVLVSDFQDSTWSQYSRSSHRIRRMLGEGDFPVHLTLLATPEPSSNEFDTGNVAIHLPLDPRRSCFVDEVVRINPTIRNHGKISTTKNILFSVDGQSLESRRVELPAGGSQQLDFACAFPEPSWHYLSVAIEGDDELLADNTAHEVIRVVAAQRVLIVDDSRSSDARSSSGAGYLPIALAPHVNEDDAANRFAVETIDSGSISADRLGDSDVVVMLNIKALAPSETAALEEFVERGGSLVVFVGDRVTPNWYNETWRTQKAFLPLDYLEHIDANFPVSLSLPRGGSHRGSLVWGIGDRALQEIELTTWMPLQGDHRASQVTDSIKTSKGATLLAVHRYGDGYVVQSGLSIGDSWSNMPKCSAYVPLMQQIVLAAIRQVELVHNARSGESLTIAKRQDLVAEGKNNGDKEGWKIECLTDDRAPVTQVVETSTVKFQHTAIAGVFRISANELSRGITYLKQFSLSNDPAESYVHQRTNLPLLADELGATVVQSVKDYVQLDTQQRNGKEIWRGFLLALIVLLVAEVLVAGRITRGAV